MARLKGQCQQCGVATCHIRYPHCQSCAAQLRDRSRVTMPTGREGTSSLYLGVIWDKERKQWRARVRKGGRAVFIGRYDIEKVAAQAFDEATREHYGARGRYNFPRAGERGAYE